MVQGSYDETFVLAFSLIKTNYRFARNFNNSRNNSFGRDMKKCLLIASIFQMPSESIKAFFAQISCQTIGHVTTETGIAFYISFKTVTPNVEWLYWHLGTLVGT